MPFLAPILSWLGSLLGGPFAKAAVEAYKAKLDKENSVDARSAALLTKELDVEAREREVNAQIVIAEQGRWYTACVRPLFALPFIIFVWKVLVWDKCLGWGSTTLPAPELMQWGGLILTAYFGGRSLEKVARVIANRNK